MRIWEWLRPGIKIKRWILFAFLGILLIAFGINEFVVHKIYSPNYKLFWAFLNVSGFFILYVSVTEGMKSIIALINKGYLKVSLDNEKIESLIYEKRLLVKGPKRAYSLGYKSYEQQIH